MRLLSALLAVTMLSAGPARTSDTALTVGEVLDSSRDRAPQVLEALARQRAAQGRAVAAEGAFDTLFATEARGMAGGPYDGRFTEAKVSRPIADWGGNVYAGYRVSGGTFAPYQSNYATDELGEATVGAVFSLMRDRLIDDRRFNLVNSRLDVAIADLERTMVAIGVQRRAAGAYNQWVAAGLRLKVHRQLLAIAEKRQQALEQQVRSGSRAAILLKEGEQALLRRQAMVLRAEQDLANAATSLSLFLRRSDGAPLKPSSARLPDGLSLLPVSQGGEAPVNSRPDLRVIDLRLQQIARRLDLERNGMLPRLDVVVEASQGMGGVFPAGLVSRRPEVTVGLRFSVPLEQRTASGRLAATGAEIDAARRRRQALEEQIAADLDRLAIDVQTAAQVEVLAGEEAQRAEQVAAAERRRFEIGAADLIVVTLREESAADARVREVDAMLRRAEATAELAAAAMDLKALGLVDGAGAWASP